MNHLLKIATYGLLITLSATAFANSECPPVASIQSKPLKQAGRLRDHQWNLISDSFTYQYRSWNVLFITELPNATDVQQALQQGNDRFHHTVITNRYPYPQNMDGISYCYYTSPTSKDRLAAMSFVQDG